MTTLPDLPPPEDGQVEGFSWIHVQNRDELQAFYQRVLPAIREAARFCGYAIGVHGSMRRDLDLIAVPWVDQFVDCETLARSVQKAACGLWQARYQWTLKPWGRIASSFPICWTAWNETNLGHIDLSIAPLPGERLLSAIASAQPAAREMREAQDLPPLRSPRSSSPCVTTAMVRAAARVLRESGFLWTEEPAERLAKEALLAAHDAPAKSS